MERQLKETSPIINEVIVARNRKECDLNSKKEHPIKAKSFYDSLRMFLKPHLGGEERNPISLSFTVPVEGNNDVSFTINKPSYNNCLVISNEYLDYNIYVEPNKIIKKPKENKRVSFEDENTIVRGCGSDTMMQTEEIERYIEFINEISNRTDILFE